MDNQSGNQNNTLIILYLNFADLFLHETFFLQNLESPLNNLREKKQKKLYINSYCIEKKIIIMLVEIW